MDIAIRGFNFEPELDGKKEIKSDDKTRHTDSGSAFFYDVILPDFLFLAGFLSVTFALVLSIF